MIGLTDGHESIHGWSPQDNVVWRRSIDHCECCHHCHPQVLGPNYERLLIFSVLSIFFHCVNTLLTWAVEWLRRKNFWRFTDIFIVWDLSVCRSHRPNTFHPILATQKGTTHLTRSRVLTKKRHSMPKKLSTQLTQLPRHHQSQFSYTSY